MRFEEPLLADRQGPLPDDSVPPVASGHPLPAGRGFPRGRQYVEAPPHSSGCPLPFRLPRPWHPGGTSLPGLPRGSTFLSSDSPPTPHTHPSRGGSVLPPTGCHSGHQMSDYSSGREGPPTPRTSPHLHACCTWDPTHPHCSKTASPRAGDSCVPTMRHTSSSGLRDRSY